MDYFSLTVQFLLTFKETNLVLGGDLVNDGFRVDLLTTPKTSIREGGMRMVRETIPTRTQG